MKFWPVVLALSGMMAAGFVVQNVGPVINPPYVPPAYDSQEYAASTSLLGQFRTSISSWLWLRTDSYMHNGVELRQMTDLEKHTGVSPDRPVNDGEKQIRNEASVVTAIPSPDRDFRGIFGDMERATSAYKDMHNHKHNDPEAALPLFRLMTWIDPTFVPGWVDGAAVISRDHSKEATLKALNFLEEGHRQDPTSIAIDMELGEISIVRLHNLPKAVEYLEDMKKLGAHPMNLLDPTENDAMEQGLRWLCLCYRDLGEHQEMEQTAIEGLHQYPDDGVLMHLLFPPPFLLKPQYRVQWQQREWQSVKNGVAIDNALE